MTSPAEKQPAPNGAKGTHLYEAWRAAESHCIKCGFCLPACPTYRETGVEASSPRGRLDLMYGVAQGQLPLEAAEREMWFCLGCLACETACPSGIRYRDILEAGRADSAEAWHKRGAPWLPRFLMNRVLTSQRWLRKLGWGLYIYQSSGLQRIVRLSRLLSLFPKLARLERQAPPVVAPRNWRTAAGVRGTTAPAPADAEALPGKGRVVALLTGCVMESQFGDVHAATVRVLRANGFAVRLPAAQNCCGALHQHAGEQNDACTLARHNIAAFEDAGHDDEPILVNAAGCGAMMKDYGQLLAHDPDWAERARRFSGRVRDISEFLAGLELVPPAGRVALKVAYDAPCHLVHAQKVHEEPRSLLAGIPGLELVPLVEAEMCCGSAGSYSVAQPEMSARLLARKMLRIRASGADVVASGNPGCLLQLRLGARRHRVPVRVRHPVELLAQAYGGGDDR